MTANLDIASLPFGHLSFSIPVTVPSTATTATAINTTAQTQTTRPQNGNPTPTRNGILPNQRRARDGV